MNQKNNENLTFQAELNEQISKLFNIKEDLRFSISLVNNVLESSIYNGIGNDSKLLIESFKNATSLAVNRHEEFKNSTSQILKTIKNLNLNLNNTLINNDKHELFKAIEDLYFINIALKNNTKDLEAEFNNYIKSENTTRNRSILIQNTTRKLENIVNLLNEVSVVCNSGISTSIRLSTNLIGISEQFQFETTKNFSLRFNEEKDIIIEDFNNKLKQITLDYELKQKEIKSEFNEIKVNFKKLKNELDESYKKNIELKKSIDNYEDTINSLSHLELNKVNKNIEISLLDTQKKAEKYLEDLHYSLKIKFTEIKTEFEEQQSNMNSEFEVAKNAKESFVQLVQNAGIYNLTENYNNKAIEEKDEYKNFRKYTTWAILAAVAFTLGVFIFAIYENSGNNSSPDYLILISRLSISAMFFILALYLSKQASKHYECYQENHRTFLQLAALEPFISKMSPEEQKEIRKGLISSYFNQNTDGKFASKGDEVDMSIVYTLLDKVSNLVPGNKKQLNETGNETGIQK
ncbi:hypothetical protein [Acinetobacter bereziniae]|uniref:hypothetical protein n=1 Tax=Acinetobacter bereziniae TaxID=106648 RepID=UPI003008DB3A